MSNFVVVGEAEVDRIIEVVLRTAKINYSEYSRDSVTRRIQRFVDRTSCVNFDELICKIENEAEYLAFFLNEMTVNVTEMFRDPSFFTVIQNHVIPKLSKKNPLNIWHAGCSSGEEVYSLAIVLHQANLLERSDITGTDINPTVLKQAAAGKYSTASLVSFQHNYDRIDCGRPLSDYYSKANGHAILNDFLKNHLTFLEHDLEQGKRIGVFDLIICRNTLIYFGIVKKMVRFENRVYLSSINPELYERKNDKTHGYFWYSTWYSDRICHPENRKLVIAI